MQSAHWLLPAIGFTALAILPLALLVWWRGPRVVLTLVLFAGVVGGGILLLIEVAAAGWDGFQKWYRPRLLGGIAALAIGLAAGWVGGTGDEPDYVTVLTILSGLWFMFWFSVFAFDMWVYALR